MAVARGLLGYPVILGNPFFKDASNRVGVSAYNLQGLAQRLPFPCRHRTLFNYTPRDSVNLRLQVWCFIRHTDRAHCLQGKG